MIEKLDARYPILLLPIRLEARFGRSAAGRPELWLRAVPDDVAIEAHEPELTIDEVAAGRVLLDAEAAGDAAAQVSAWRALVKTYGDPRAAWIARTAATAGEPVATSWNHPARTRVMPERLAFLLYRGEQLRHHVVGAAIPDPLVVGPDPSEFGALRREGEQLVVDEPMRWMIDLDAAVAVGMAVRVPLDDEDARLGFDRIVALGVRVGDDPASGRRRLEALLESHHYSGGLGCLRPGTPTNHTAGGPGGVPGEDHAASLARERGPRIEPAGERTEGRRLADALGIDADVLARIRDAGATDRSEEAAMNQVLSGATLAPFLAEQMHPVCTEATARAARRFFVEHVSGSGALPILRVGRQPYGVLPITSLGQMKWQQGDDPVLPQLASLLFSLRREWEGLVTTVPRAGTRDASPTALTDVLALHPTSVEIRARTLIGREHLAAMVDVERRAAAGYLRVPAEARAELLDLIPGAGSPRILGLFFARQATVVATSLVEALPADYLTWLRDATTAQLRDQDVGVDERGDRIPPPAALLYQLLRSGLLGDLWRATTGVLVRTGVLAPGDLVVREALNLGRSPDLTRWDHLALELPGRPGRPASARLSEYRTEPDVAIHAATRAAMARLASVPRDRLERLLIAHLDLLAYRLDAWLVGLVSERLARGRDPAGPAAQGIYVGAFGWLEDLRPTGTRAPAGRGGAILAPSLSHAVTASIMRAGRLGHATPDAPGLLAAELASRRARLALDVLDAARTGEPAGALLGARFERDLHEQDPALGLPQFLPELRSEFPLAGDPGVLDGLALARAAADAYPPAAGLPEASSTAGTVLRRVLARLVESLDAVADMLLAEGVHQVAQGGFAAAGTVAPLWEGGTPPAPRIAETPRSGISVTHRIVWILPDDGPYSGWAQTARALADPRLERWVASFLPAPARLRCLVDLEGDPTRRAEVGADQLGLAALDVLAAPDLATLMGGTPRIVERDPSWTSDVISWSEVEPLLAALRAMLSRARPLAADDLMSPARAAAQSLPPTFEAAELQARIRAARSRLDDGDPRGAQLDAALAAGDVDGLVAASVQALGVRPIPRSTLLDPLEVVSSLGDQGSLLGDGDATEDFLEGARRVRESVHALERARSLAATLGGAEHGDVRPVIVQAPHVPGARWLARPLTPTGTRPRSVNAAVIFAERSLDPAAPLAGLVLDEWTEMIPDPEVSAAVAFQADRPAAEAPQTLLLAIAPARGERWRWGDLVAAVSDAFALARIRAVDPDRVYESALGFLGPMLVSETSAQPVTFDVEPPPTTGVLS